MLDVFEILIQRNVNNEKIRGRMSNMQSIGYEKNSNSVSEKDIPILYTEKKECCGCSACYTICPVGAITMEEDNEGFLYPRINGKKCIRCEKCINICTFKSDMTGI